MQRQEQMQPPTLTAGSEDGKHLLLSLDGGGVRGLSSLVILDELLQKIDPDNPPKPCDHFDMIGGTSTGGLIAIMLGRLGMTIAECLEAYRDLSNEVFQQANYIPVPWFSWPWNWLLKGRFDSAVLERAIKKIIVKALKDQPGNRNATIEELENTLFWEKHNPKCKVLATAVSEEHPNEATVFTNYTTKRGAAELIRSAKIWEVARATSAASTYFDPIAIGPYGENFIDGGTVSNNPVEVVFREARDIWKPENDTEYTIQDEIQCLISIGTGIPTVNAFGRTLRKIGQSLIDMATETERTAGNFLRDRTKLHTLGRYFRFNVLRGLEEVGLEESKMQPKIVAATRAYVRNEGTQKEMESCVQTVRLRECRFNEPDFS